MEKRVELICAYSFSDASKCIMERLKSVDKFDINSKHILIVPDSVSLSTEKEFLSVVGGALNIHILTFSRLMKKVLGYTETLSKQAELIALTNVVMNVKNKFKCFTRGSDSFGFINSLFNVINQLKYSKIAPNDLKTEHLPKSLESKVEDIRLVYSQYEEFLKGRFLTDSNAMVRFAESIQNSSFIDNADIYIKDFDSFSKQNIAIIEKLVEYAGSVTIACPYADEEDLSILYLNETYHAVTQMCRKRSYKLDITYVKKPQGEKGFIIDHLLTPKIAHIDNGTQKKWQIESNYITINNGANFKEEIEMLAGYIAKEVKNGANYGDFTVITDKIDNYTNAIKDIFPLYAIPYYADIRDSLVGHAFCMYILDLLNVYRTNYSQNAVFCFIKSFFFAKDNKYVVDFVNYSLKYNLSHRIFQPFKYGQDSQEYDGAIRVQQEIIENVPENLIKSKDSGESYVDCIYAFIEKNNLLDKLNDLINIQEQLGLWQEANSSRQVFIKFQSILDSIKVLINKNQLSLDEFYTLLEKGCSSLYISTIKSAVNSVNFVSIAKARSHILKKVCVIGAYEGAFPKLIMDLKLLSDENLSVLASKGIDIEPSIRTQNQRARFDVYQLFLEDFKSMYISYPSKADEENAKEALAVKHLLKMFEVNNQEMRINCVDLQQIDYQSVVSKDLAKRKLLEKVCMFYDGTISNLAAVAPVYYALDDKNIAFRKEEDMKFIDCGEKLFSKNHSTSLSRIECYYKCPKMHFLRYGIKAFPLENGELDAIVVGNIIHRVLELFIKNNLNNSLVFDKIARTNGINRDEYLSCQYLEKRKEYIKKSIQDEYKKAINENDIYVALSEQIEYIQSFKRMEKECVVVANAIVNQINSSNYYPTYLEYKFGDSNPVTVKTQKGEYTLTGIIDRIDIYGEKALIFDYKTGYAKNDIKDIEKGEKLQLTTYLSIVDQMGLQCKGLYYLKVNNQFDNNSSGLLTGVTIEDIDEIKEIDTTADETGSKLLNIKFTNEGKINQTYAKRVISKSHIEHLKNRTLEIIVNALENTTKGHIDLLPYVNACKFCEYKDICAINDREIRTERKEVIPLI